MYPNVFHPSIVTVINKDNDDDIRRIMGEMAWAEHGYGTYPWVYLSEADEIGQALDSVYTDFESARITLPLKDQVPLALLAAYLDKPEQALKFLEEDIRTSSLRMLLIWMPVFSDMRRLPGFSQLMIDIGLHNLWQSTGQWPDYCQPESESSFACF